MQKCREEENFLMQGINYFKESMRIELQNTSSMLLNAYE